MQQSPEADAGVFVPGVVEQFRTPRALLNAVPIGSLPAARF
jgi:hypothetical protein